MVAATNQRWITYAGDDEEAWKCILLARSLKASLTTRKVGVLISGQVSERLRERLQDEFDVCTKIGESRMKQDYGGFSFSTAAKLFSWKIRGLRKFVFLSCNSLVVKNSDQLFRKNGLRRSKTNGRIDLIIGNASLNYENVQVNEILLQLENGTLETDHVGSIFPKLENCYGVEVNWGQHYSTPITGDEIKILSFPNQHPLNSIGLKQNGTHFSVLEKVVARLCEKLMPEKLVGLLIPPTVQLEQNADLSDSIAIVGMSCRFPGANNVEEFWKLLEEGLEGICKVPDGRWTKDNSHIRLTNIRDTEAGFLACPIDRFDAKFFNTNSADMAYMDPQQRLTLKIVWESLEHAGINPETLKNSLTGVFGGWWRNDYKEILQETAVVNETEFFRAYMGNALGTLTARISHFFELVGPSVSTESGCSTSIVGVDMACDSLRNESCDIALAVGANLLLHPFSVNLMNTVIAMDGRCKTFDADADGFGRAEGVAALVLKRYPDAVAAGDRIWGLIRGSAVVQEGTSKSMGTPTVDSEGLAMELALERAGVCPKDVSFVETHGTGTPVGDPLEMAAVARVYSKGRTEVLTVGSVKTNIGHTESACGIAGIIKTVLSMKHELIPKHLNFNNLNPDINLTAIPAQLPLQAIEWKKRGDGKQRIAGVSSFGITGTDAHVIVQETPEHFKCLSFAETRPIKIFTLSGKSEESLLLQIKAYRDFIQTTSLSLEDIEFTQHTGRPHFPFRKPILASTKDELLKELDVELGAPLKKMKPAAIETCPKICFLFTGQGSQYPGMAKSLYDNSLVFQTHFDLCESILSKNYGFHLKDALWGDKEELLKRTLYSQTSIFCVEYCLLKLWESWGIKPDTCVGHSLGEFTAAVASGLLSFDDALKLVVTRSKLIDELPNASMIVVGASLKTVENLLHQAIGNKDKLWLDVAAVNSNEQTVLAGPTESVNKFVAYCDNNNLKSHILDASHAFHSRLMDPMLQKYADVAATVLYNEPKCQFISGVEGKVVRNVDVNYWMRHTRDRVRFLNASETALKAGNSTFLEIGPHPVLTAMVMINSDSVEMDDPLTCLASLRKKTNDCDTILTTLSKLYSMGYPINWENFHRYSSAKKVDLPGYVFEEKKYWLSIQDDGSIPFHPLVGGYLPNPSPTKIFRNDLSVNRVPFLKDHALGDKLIFPGAGYLEMCLTAGYAATSCPEGIYAKPSSAVTVQNFSIHSPVCLNEKSSTEFQVIVSKATESGDTLSTVYTKLYTDANSFKWIRHASANFHSTTSSANESTPSLDSIRERCCELVPASHDYNFLERYGYNFGPSFKTLTTAWTTIDATLQESLLEFTTLETSDTFVLHPCVIDAMFQAQIVSTGTKPKSNTVLVPVQVDSFTCFGSLQTKSGYIYVTQGSVEGVKDVHLFDSNGVLVAKMLGTEFVETTINNILALIESNRNPYPRMYDYAWREFLGPCERRAQYADFTALEFLEEDALKLNTFTAEEEEFFQSSETLFGLYMVQGVIKLGIQDHIVSKTKFAWPNIAGTLGVLPELTKFLRYILIQLAHDGWFEISLASPEEMFFKPIKPFPSIALVSAEIAHLKQNIRAKKVGAVDADCIEPLGENLSEILSGRVSALSLMFPEGTNVTGPAELFYMDSLFQSKIELMNQYAITPVIRNFSRLPSAKASSLKPIIRVLEVGAGTGSATKVIIPHILAGSNGAKFEYTYTDISNVFLKKGEELFQDTGIQTNFKILNIEQDPLAQGFIPGHYDLILASYVIHATRDIKQTICQMKKLLKPSGNLVLLECIKPHRAINLLVGGLEQYWNYTDVSLRPYNCELSLKKWEDALRECGFGNFSYMSCFNSINACISASLNASDQVFQTACPDSSLLTTNTQHRPTWVVFGNNSSLSNDFVHKLRQCGRNVVLLTPDEFKFTSNQVSSNLQEKIFRSMNDAFCGDLGKGEGIAYLWGLDRAMNYREICEPYLYGVAKYLSQSVENVRLVTYTKGNLNVGHSDFVFNVPDASPIIGMTNGMVNEIPGLVAKCVDIDPSCLKDDPDIIMEAFTELFTNDSEYIVAYRKNRRYAPRLQPYKIKNTALPLPSSSRYQMILSTSNMISDLRFAPFKQKPLMENEIEIEVKAYALNFRDLMVVIKPDPLFESYTTVGIDYSGIVTTVGRNATLEIGDRVLGARNDGTAIPSHVVTKGDHVFKIPEKMTFADASTLPVAFTTVSLCFLDIAKIKEGDIVLIHTGSGGVGLAAIMVAQWKKCIIVATAGSERKRKYLRNLGVQHVFNSRTTEYEHEIRKALGGRGVDVVLNSLTGPGFKEATLAVCANEARFVEISKMNIWSKEEVQALRPDVMYEIADISSMNEEEITAQFMPVKEMLDSSGYTRPLPYTSFELTEIRDALEHMQEARHIGKIVITMPNHSVKTESKFNLFNDNATYMITGGLGGIGLEIAKWMSRRGAKNLLLVSRSLPTKEVDQELDEIRSRKINVVVRVCDIGNFEECQSLIDDININTNMEVDVGQNSHCLPPLRGIMHAAGVLADGTLEAQTWEKYETVFNAKIKGSWNLHELTLHQKYPLEHFVVFSSLAAVFGSMGQTNHAAGNYYLDTLVHYRNSLGLPGTTVNWGQWGQVGVAANLNLPGVSPFTVVQGIAALENVLKTHKTQIAVCEGDAGIARKAFPIARQLLSEIEEEDNSLQTELDGDAFWKEYDAVNTREEKYDVVRKNIRALLRLNLKLDKNEEIDDHANFQDMGMDSLMMVEMKNALQLSIGKRVKISIASVKDFKTVAQLSLRLVELISGKEELPPPTREELQQLIIEDSVLPETISADKSTNQELKKLSNISTVLVTGATGTLGPYIVCEILKQPSIQKLYCLMKENKLFSPLERFKRIFQAKNLLHLIDLSKVDFIVGDVSEPNLGISDNKYAKLSVEVDVIFHLAVKASFNEIYAKTEDPKHSRNINVVGIKNVLTFAVEERLKYVYHASTMIAETQMDSDGRFWEDWPVEGEFDNQPNSAYPICKYICDRLVSKAVEKGVPCKAFRFPNIGGDSITGENFQIMDNHLMIRLLAYMHMGFMPAQRVPMSILPVDTCAKFSVALFFNEETGNEMFNVCNPYIFDEREFDDVAEEFGVEIDVLDPEEFFEKAGKLDPENNDVVQIIRIGLSLEYERERFTDNLPEPYIKWLQGNNTIFFSTKMSKYFPNEYPSMLKDSLDLLKRDLQFAKDTGVFDKFRIKYSDPSGMD